MIIGIVLAFKIPLQIRSRSERRLQQRERSKYMKLVMLKNCAETGGGIRESKDEQEKAFPCLLVFIVHGR